MPLTWTSRQRDLSADQDIDDASKSKVKLPSRSESTAGCGWLRLAVARGYTTPAGPAEQGRTMRDLRG